LKTTVKIGAIIELHPMQPITLVAELPMMRETQRAVAESVNH